MKLLTPAPRLLGLLAGWLGLAIVLALLPWLINPAAASWLHSLQQLLWLGLLFSITVVLYDAWHGWRKPPTIQIKRLIEHNIPVNGWSEVSLEIQHALPTPLNVEICDFYPNSAQVTGMPQKVSLPSGQFARLSYRIRPEQRGEIEFGLTQLRIISRWGFWRFNRYDGHVSKVRVYPDFAAIAHYQLLASDQRTSQLGIKRKPRRGLGLEFMQLRDYREGDTLRQIDWKATIRRDQLVSRQYQDERDQQIIFLLDCSRSMRSRDDHLSHFDHALNALLLLSYVALKQGDAVGLMSFGGQQRWLAPRKGQQQLNTILNHVFDLHPCTDVADYPQAIQQLLKQQHRRALVILISKQQDQALDELLPLLPSLKRRHLLLIANLQEQIIEQLQQQAVHNHEQALSWLAACDYQQQRQTEHRRLSSQGAQCLNVTPQQLPSALVNRYWEIKRSGML